MPVNGDSPPALSGAAFPNLDSTFREARHLEAATGVAVAILALTLGVLADRLFFGSRAGVNVLVWNGAMIGSLLVMRRRLGLPVRPLPVACLGGSLLLSAMVVWRASDTLQAFNLLAAAALLILAVALPPGIGLRRLSPLRGFETAVLGAFELTAGAVAIAMMKCWQDQAKRFQSRDLQYFARAALIASILLAIFGGLFIAADAVIEAEVTKLASIDVAAIARHLLLIAVVSWLSAGAFWGFLAVEAKPAELLVLGESWRVRTAENAIVLGSLAVLFTAFVLVQLRYLFGGEDVVLKSVDLTYAQYARRGFFELVAVAALLLPVLLALDWARTRTPNAGLVFRGLAAILIALLFVIMASALQRLRIYEEAFGLTETRLYVAVALFWFAAVFAWFLATIGRDRRDDFAAGALITAIVALVVVNMLNPDGFIAASNTHRLSSGKTFDAEHALSLSADAVPTLISHLDRLASEDACAVAAGLLQRWPAETNEARSWNFGRERAIDAVADNWEMLLAACPPGATSSRPRR